MEKSYSIYCFKDNGKIVYIGMTCNSKIRFAAHINKAKRRNTPKDKWIMGQVARNKFTPIILFSNLSEHEAHNKERELLQQFMPMFNVLTYTRTDKTKKPPRSETFEFWMIRHIHNWVNHFIQS